jgi:hypothetical protein
MSEAPIKSIPAVSALLLIAHESGPIDRAAISPVGLAGASFRCSFAVPDCAGR